MPRQRKIDQQLAEVWIAMMTNGAMVGTRHFAKMVGLPQHVVHRDLFGVNKIAQSTYLLRLRHEDCSRVRWTIAQLQVKHAAYGHKRMGWNTAKLSRAIDAIDYAWTMVALGASGADAASVEAS